MSNYYPLFKYIPGDSKLHMMNSKMKILWFLLTSLIVFLIRDYKSLFLLLIFLLLICYETKIKFYFYFYNLFMVWPIYIISLSLSYLFTFKLGLSVLTTSKIILIILIFLIITFTTSLSEIAWGFECLFEKLKKFKIPVSKISLMIAFFIKFISTLFEQYRMVRKSMAYRGVSYSKSKIKTFKKIFIPVVTLSYKLSKRMIVAMKLRFYGYSKTRTNYHSNKTTVFDKILIMCDIIIMYITIGLGWIS